MSSGYSPLQKELKEAGPTAQVLVADYFRGHNRSLVISATAEQLPAAAPVSKMWLKVLLALQAHAQSSPEVCGYLDTARATAQLMGFLHVQDLIEHIRARNAQPPRQRVIGAFDDFVVFLANHFDGEIASRVPTL